MEKTFKDYHLGEKILTSSITVTESHIVNFASYTGDFYPLHMDEEYAKNSMFKGRIAHGPLIFSLSVGLVGMTGYYKDSIIAFVGGDEMRFFNPVKIGDTIRVEVEVVGKVETSRPERGIVKFKYTVLNQNNVKIMSIIMSQMVHKKI